MKYWLKCLLGCSVTLRVGRYELYTYGDGTMAFRKDNGLMSPSERMGLAGFRRLLTWIDQEETEYADR